MDQTVHSVKVLQGGRLVFMGRQPDADFWQEWAERKSIDNQMGDVLRRWLVLGAILRFLSRGGRILDAGCGSGTWTVALREMGYEAHGVDWSTPVVERAKSEAPALPMVAGDVLALPYRSDAFDAYFSMGVVEHFEEGPHRALQEAHRILRDRGIALIAVPFFNWLRRAKAAMGYYGDRAPTDLPFYQYAFSAQEFNAILVECGFHVLARIPFAAGWGLEHELPRVYRAGTSLRRPADAHAAHPDSPRPLVQRWMRIFALWVLRSRAARTLTGHMVLFVVRRTAGDAEKAA